jgi:hypothetical protein
MLIPREESRYETDSLRRPSRQRGRHQGWGERVPDPGFARVATEGAFLPQRLWFFQWRVFSHTKTPPNTPSLKRPNTLQAFGGKNQQRWKEIRAAWLSWQNPVGHCSSWPLSADHDEPLGLALPRCVRMAVREACDRSHRSPASQRALLCQTCLGLFPQTRKVILVFLGGGFWGKSDSSGSGRKASPRGPLRRRSSKSRCRRRPACAVRSCLVIDASRHPGCCALRVPILAGLRGEGGDTVGASGAIRRSTSPTPQRQMAPLHSSKPRCSPQREDH